MPSPDIIVGTGVPDGPDSAPGRERRTSVGNAFMHSVTHPIGKRDLGVDTHHIRSYNNQSISHEGVY